MFSEMFIIQNWIHILMLILQIRTPIYNSKGKHIFYYKHKRAILAKSKQQVNPLTPV